MALYPEGPAGRHIYSSSHTFAIPATVSDRPAAIELLRFLTSRESQAYEASLGTLPARSDSLRDVRSEAGPLAERRWNLERAQEAARPPKHANYPAVEDAIWEGIREALLGNKSVEKALEDTEAAARRAAEAVAPEQEEWWRVESLTPRRGGLWAVRDSVSPLCVGCAPLGDMPETFDFSVDEERARETRAVLGSQINFLDTAASYGDGESERRIGEVLAEMGGLPEGIVLATKADRNLTTGDFSGEQMRRSVERSLRLLGMDILQLVYLHDPEHESFEHMMSDGGPVEVLTGLRKKE